MNPYANITGRDFTGEKPAPKSTSVTADHDRYQKYTVKPAATPMAARIPRKPSAGEEIPPAKKTTRLTPFRMLVGFTCLTILMILWVWETTTVREGLRTVEALKDQKLAVEKANEAIRTDITRLSGYQRIEKIATEHLRMIRAKDKPGVIFIDPNDARTIKEAGE